MGVFLDMENILDLDLYGVNIDKVVKNPPDNAEDAGDRG